MVSSSFPFSKVEGTMIEVEEMCGFDTLMKESERKLNFSPLRVCIGVGKGD